MSSDEAPYSIASPASAIMVPANGPMICTPSTRSVLASARIFTKPSVDAFARESGLDHEHVIVEIFESRELDDYDRGRIGAEQFFEAIRSRLKIGMDAGKMRQLWDDIFRENTPVADLIRRWHGMRPMFLISNTCQSHVEQFERQFDLFGLFRDRIYSCHVGLLKPEVEIYELALNRFGVEASKTLFVDDRPENIEGARKAGFYGVHFQGYEDFLRQVGALGML